MTYSVERSNEAIAALGNALRPYFSDDKVYRIIKTLRHHVVLIQFVELVEHLTKEINADE